jgi:hypothetical protein
MIQYILVCVFSLFLLSMNEVNIKYWFRIFWTNKDFLSKKNRFVRKKKFRHLPTAVYRLPCRLPRKVWLSTSTFSVQLRDFSFWISDWFGPQSKQIPSSSSDTNFWLLFHFLVKYWPILMFLGLIWCKILCWAQKSIYGV